MAVKNGNIRKLMLVCLTGMTVLAMTACGENNKETHDAALASVISEKEISVSYADWTDTRNDG